MSHKSNVEGKITVFLDNNIWDFLFTRGMDICAELPADTFDLFVTREGEFELDAIPDVDANGVSKLPLKQFIASTRARCGIRVQSFFGYPDPRFPAGEQRVGGYDDGWWAPSSALDFIQAQRQLRPEKPNQRRSKLYPLEADISLAARSFSATVLTYDEKKGPLRDARAQGGCVLYISEFLDSGLTLQAFALRRSGLQRRA